LQNLADLDVVYACGTFQLKKINIYAQKQEPYNPEDAKANQFAFREKKRIKKPYGKYSDVRYFRSELLIFRLM
jgi:hypothetical protein